MQALPPAPPISCVTIADANLANVRMRITVSGRADQVEAWFNTLSEKSSWHVVFDQTMGNERSITLVGPIAVPWGEVGRLGYEARSRKLAITFASSPTICEFKYG